MSSTIPALNEAQHKVLVSLASIYGNEANCMYFRGIAADTKLDIPTIRRACRYLARKGYAEYVRGLFDEEGMAAGSGYSCTEKGQARIDADDVETQKIDL